MTDDSRPTIIKLHDDGPLRVKGPVTVLDADGNAFDITRKSFFLCRCGASKNKPFCDGSHNNVAFTADERRLRTNTAGVSGGPTAGGRP